MPANMSRRRFLKAGAAAGAAVGLGEIGGLSAISAATAAEARVTADLVQFRPDIEPIVRLIEDTPQEKCPAVMFEQLRGGLPYRQFLAAMFLAALRSGAFDHNVFVIHSAHQLALDIPATERLLPAFWALDSFKGQQAAWKKMEPEQRRRLVGTLPPPETAEQEFHVGMETWDDERAGWALVALARSRGAGGVIEPMLRYAARDWRYIGHLAIWVSNTWRALQTIGWQHAEPALRNTAYGLVSQGKSDLHDQPYPSNLERVERTGPRLAADWAGPAASATLANELLLLWRSSSGAIGSPINFAGKRDDACDLAAKMLAERKARAGDVWDAIHLIAAECIMYAQKGSTPLHASTATNALHYAFEISEDPKTQLLILLQGLGWLFHFRKEMSDNNWIRGKPDITEFGEEKIPDDPQRAAAEVLADLSFGPEHKPADAIQWYGIGSDRFCDRSWLHVAARRAFALASRDGAAALAQLGRRLLPMKASGDPHRIKFPVAMLENADWVSPRWRPHLLAASVFSFQGSDAPDTPVMVQVRDALRQL